MFIETSAKTHNNVDEAFIKSVESFFNNIKKTPSKNFNDKLKNGNENEFEIKLTDYGLAKNYQNNSNSDYSSIVGTNYYIAPEVYQYQDVQNQIYGALGLFYIIYIIMRCLLRI